MGNIFVVTKVSTLLIITWVSSGFKKIAYINLSIPTLNGTKMCILIPCEFIPAGDVVLLVNKLGIS